MFTTQSDYFHNTHLVENSNGVGFGNEPGVCPESAHPFAKELTECLKMQLAAYIPSDEQIKHTEESDVGLVRLCESGISSPFQLDNLKVDRDDLAVTVKLFLSRLDAAQARECLESVMNELQTGHIERLIVAFPCIQLDDDEDVEEEEEAELMVARLAPLWEGLEQLVKEKKIKELGVADLELPFLRALHAQTLSREGGIPPAINHYNIQGCCAVPQELQAFAKEKGIKLLTHNDPKPFCPDKKLEEISTASLGVKADCCSEWGVRWVARYAVMIVSRSVVTAKGYTINFEKNVLPNCTKT